MPGLKPVKPAHQARAHRLRRGLVAAALTLGFGLSALAPPFTDLTRSGIDLLLPARQLVSGPLFPPEASDVVVIALDEQTYHTPPFDGLPKVAWTPALAKVIDGVLDAKASAIGLDMVLPTSFDRPALVPGYDRPFLTSLRRAADTGKLVLGEAVLSRQPLRPHPAQIIAARGPANLRPLNLILDDDDVVRRYATRFATNDGGLVTSFGAELAARAGAHLPEGTAIFPINFNTGPDDVPLFSLADILACTEAGDAAYLTRAFAGKIVLIGEVLDLEDRFRSAKRFTPASGEQAQTIQRCRVPRDPVRFGALGTRRSMPGVLIHAGAINTITKGAWLTLLPPLPAAAGGALWFGLLGALFFRLRPLAGLSAGLAGAGGLFLLAVLLFTHGLVLPVVPWMIGAALLFGAIYAYRFVVEGRSRRQIQHAFRHYLAPSLVERLAEDHSALVLGGETRQVTVFFSDMAGFTTLSESLRDQPRRLVDIMNRYLTVIAGAVEQRGGYVDKFIGDAVMALWGAPLAGADSEKAAVAAALDALAGLAAQPAAPVPLGTRIGIASGAALVGNMGSASRFNYTAVGDVVNLAARLEGANRYYGTSLIVAEATAATLDADFLLRPLDRLVVKGRSAPEAIFEVIGRLEDVPAGRRAAIAAFTDALAAYYRQDFAVAEAGFAQLAAEDQVAQLYCGRAKGFRVTPPPPGWDGRFTLDTK